MAKNQAKAKQHPKVEISLFENNSLSLSTLLPKNKRRYSKRCTKKQGRFFKCRYIINDNENETEN